MSQYASIGWIGEEELLNDTYIRRDEYTTRGQIGTHDASTGDFNLLPAGANGYVLSSNNLQTMGLEWIAFPDALASVTTRTWAAGTGRNTTNSTDNVGIGHGVSVANVSNNVIIGSGASSAYSNTCGIGYNAVAGNIAFAGGASSRASEGCVSLGWQAGSFAVTGTSCTLIGVQTYGLAGFTNMTAVGGSSGCTGANATSLGAGVVSGANTVCINGYADVSNSTVVGTLSVASGNNTEIYGYNNRSGASTGNMIFGRNSGHSGLLAGSTANLFAGSNIASATLTTGVSNTLLGSDISVSGAATSYAVAVGANIANIGSNSVAAGVNINVTGANITALGPNIVASQSALTKVFIGGSGVTIPTLNADALNSVVIGGETTVTGTPTRFTVVGGNNIVRCSDSCYFGPGIGNAGQGGSGNIIMGYSAFTQSIASASNCIIIGKGAQLYGSPSSDAVIMGRDSRGSHQTTVVGANNLPSMTSGGDRLSVFGLNNVSNAAAPNYSTICGSLNGLGSNAYTNVLGSNNTISHAYTNILGYGLTTTQQNQTLIGNSNDLSAHQVRVHGYLHTTNVTHCAAYGTGQTWTIVGPSNVTLDAIEADDGEFPTGASLFDNANDRIYLSPTGTESRSLMYNIFWEIRGTSSNTTTRWQITVTLTQPGASNRTLAAQNICSQLSNNCAVSGATAVRINGTVTSRPYITFAFERIAGAGDFTVGYARLGFHRIA